MSEPLLSMQAGLYLAEDMGREASEVSFALSESSVLTMAFSRATNLPVFGRCGPRVDTSITIQTCDLLGCAREAVDTQVERIRLFFVDHDTKKLQRTPWFCGGRLDELSAHVESTCAPLRKKILVVVNPKSGQGHAMRLVTEECLPILHAAGAEVDMVFTESPQHATQIIKEKRDMLIYDAVLSAGGDGTFHELLAGLLNRADWRDVVDRVALLQIPCGSGNALAASSGHRTVSRAAYAAVRGTRAPLDIATIIQPSTGARIFSFLSITYGLIANLDIGTEHLRWMGAQRFVWGAIREILAQRTYRANVWLFAGNGPGLADPSVPTRSTACKYPELRVLRGLVAEDDKVVRGRELDMSGWERVPGDGGFQLFSMANLPWLDMNFNLHPGSQPGSYNFVYCNGKQGIAKGFELLTAAEKGKHASFPWVNERQITAFRIDPIAEDTWLVVDGEAIKRETIYGEVHTGLVMRLL